MALSKIQSESVNLADNFAFTGTVSGAGSNIKEQLVILCDGQDYTVSSGTYTAANVTATQVLTTSYADLTGSSISYTPPTGTTMVRYQFIFHHVYDDAYGLSHYKLFIDSDEATKQRTTLGANQNPQWQQTLTYHIPIGGSADTTTGRQATWTSSKTLKIQVRDYGSANEAKVHGLFHWDGVGNAQVIMPKLMITALG